MPVVLMKVNKTIKIPDGVKITVRSRVVQVEGPRGKLTRNFRHAQVTIHKIAKTNEIIVEKRFSKKKRCAVVKTIAGHIQNMIVGVTKGFRYKMKLVYAHFPINATITDGGKGIELRNYIGQKDTRRIKMLDGVTIKDGSQKDELYLEGNDIEQVSHSASAIWQSCRVSDKDIRKFLDGVYVHARGVQGDEIPI